MRVALGLARRGLGRTWPNPAVGCVIVQAGQVVGRGWTQPGGRPHAETEALQRAGKLAQGATVYVTLEPCAHHGKTPPCAEALIKAEIARVIVAIEDPDPRVSGRGIELLEEAGIEVLTGLCEDEALALNAGFFKGEAEGLPLVTLKLATSLDGRIALASGESQWITGDAARVQGHRLRAEHDAILIGRGTAVADDPSLTCRLPGMEVRSPVRVVLDRNFSLGVDSALVRSAAHAPLWVIGSGDGAGTLEAEDGVRCLKVPEAGGGVDMRTALKTLANEGITRVLVEGGAQVAASLLTHDLVDQLAWFHAPLVIGASGKAAVETLDAESLAAIQRFRRESVCLCDGDILQILVKNTGNTAGS